MDKLLAISYDSKFYIEFTPLFAKRMVTVKPAMSIQDALDMLAKDVFIAIIVDTTLLEDTKIIDVLRQSSLIPIIAYSKEDNPIKKAESLQGGADEYFVDIGNGEIDDIYASVKALRRRFHEYGEKTKEANVLILGDIIIRLNTRKVLSSSGDIRLNKREFDVLIYLINNKRMALTYEQIFNEIWGGSFQRKQINAVRCQMHRLTAKLSPPHVTQKYIINIRDYGYQINPVLLAKSEKSLIPAHSSEKKAPVALVVGYEQEELMRVKLVTTHGMQCQQAASIYIAINMIITNEYALIMINSDNDEYLLSIKLVRELTLAPILVTTNAYDISKKNAAIDNGADGYMQIRKHNEDSYETARALIRRYIDYSNSEETTIPLISRCGILLDLNKRKATALGNEISLSSKEFDILKLIINQNGNIVTYEQICEYAWGEKYNYGTYKPLMRMIYRLKEKIRTSDNAPEYIINVRGIGYRLNTEIDH